MARAHKQAPDLSGFERYHPARHQYPKRENQVAITRTGNFSITDDLGQLLLDDSGQKGWVQLLFNPSSRQIAIVQAEKEDPDIIRISRIAKGQRFQVTARRFLERYNIEIPDKSKAFTPTARLVDGKQVLFIEI
jgi:hypothetical protein